MSDIIIENYISKTIADIPVKIFFIQVKEILPIYYITIRGKDYEEGVVQSVLSKRRMSSIKDFVLNGNTFYNLFILNWSNKDYNIKEEDNKLIIPSISKGAQVIDGQHRLEGIKQAYDENSQIGEMFIPVLLLEHLTTQNAAKIFLNINTEQKPVPNSLVYDLFGEVKDKNYYIIRATDIANMLHNSKDSPYYQCVKMPGASQGMGKVDLSTIVNALKHFTKDDGIFEQYNLSDFESQYKIIANFFTVLKNYYEKEDNWLKSVNPFMSNAGCYAGIDFMCKELITKCVEKKSFEISVISEMLPLDIDGLLYRDEIKNKQGKEQRSIIYNYLKSTLLRDVPSSNEYKF